VKNLVTRTITGVFFVAAIIGSMVWHPAAFMAVAYILMIAGMLEYFRIVSSGDVFPQRYNGLAAGSIVFLLPSLASLGWISPKFLVILPTLVMLFFAAELFRNKPNSLQNLTFTLLPVGFIAIPMATLFLLMSPLVTEDQPHWHLLFGFFIISWSYDTFAYLTGIWLGKHKLFEKISPKKTWEGTGGGAIFGLVAAMVMSVFFPVLTPAEWIAGGLIIMVTGTLGDLSESLLKRNCHVKDSGTFFPGHGGVLDRFDSILFAAPAFFCYLILLNL
jgi:phosphatidate cytidylyltransferase